MEQKEQPTLNRCDVGMGTPYERISLWEFFKSLDKKNKINSSIELPRDGMYGIMGLNSIWLSKEGVDSTMFVEGDLQKKFVSDIAKKYGVNLNVMVYGSLDELKKIPSGSVDLVFAFNVISGYPDMLKIIEQMGRISKKYVFFTYMNKLNYGYFIHKLHHKKTKEPWDHTDLNNGDLDAIESRLKPHHLFFEKKIIIDAPWWPDIGAPIGNVVGDLIPFLKKDKGNDEKNNDFYFPLEDVPYFNSERYNQLKKKMAKDFFIENNFPYFIKILFAHHIGVLFSKDNLKQQNP